MADAPVERRRGLFSWVEEQLTIPVVVGGAMLLLSAGQIRYRFELMEAKVAVIEAKIEAEDQIIATKDELYTVEQRLEKWIRRAEALQEELNEVHLNLVRMEASNGMAN
jgi:hypothetical protein